MMVWSLTTDSPQMDILECEVKWALGSISTKNKKLVEMTEFQLSYFKS